MDEEDKIGVVYLRERVFQAFLQIHGSSNLFYLLTRTEEVVQYLLTGKINKT